MQWSDSFSDMRFKSLPSIIASSALIVAASIGIAWAEPRSDAPTGSSVISQASTDQVAAFSILATPRAPEDDIDARSVDSIEATLATAARANVRLAHRIGAADATEPAWLVPGDGQVCIVTHEVGRASFQCVATMVAARGDALQTRSGGADLNEGDATVLQLLPDGVPSVTVRSTKDNVETEVPVRQNWVQKSLSDPSTITFDLAGASRTVELGGLPR